MRQHSVDAVKAVIGAVIGEEEHISLTRRDSLGVLDLLENPPKPKAKLLSAAKAPPKRK